ncbi:hypothetical protein, partial [Alistipes sp.]|uniref:hypothetical protein n=1 Tax=Alistipes sp. TaxID=1872444 RepID=UPI003AAB1C2E
GLHEDRKKIRDARHNFASINNKNRPFHARNPRKRLRRHPYANESFASLSTCKSGNVCYLCNGFVSEVTN